MVIRAALLDMDGTIYDSGIDWRALRDKIDLPLDGRPILEQLSSVGGEARERGLAALHHAEAKGAANGRMIGGAHELLDLLRRHRIACALVTNNSRRSAETVLGRHDLRFDLVLTRDDGTTKPDPQLFLDALARLRVPPEEAIVIGDAHLDLLAARAAGIPGVILVGTPEWMRAHIPETADHKEARDLFHVAEIVESILAGGAESD